jgi:hypothetical protein
MLEFKFVQNSFFNTTLKSFRVVQYFVEIRGFANCGLAHLNNLRICDKGMSQKFTDLRKKFALYLMDFPTNFNLLY